MPYGMEMKVKCPYFRRYNKNIHYQNITITCEPLEKNLGFEVTLKSCFHTLAERRDFMELFCCDRYEHCPMYKAIHERRTHDKA